MLVPSQAPVPPFVPAPPPQYGQQQGRAPGLRPGSEQPPAMHGSQQPAAMHHPDPRWRAQQDVQTGGAFRPAPITIVGPPAIVFRGKPDPRLVLLNEPDSSRAVSFRVLRDNLLAKGLPRVLAVSSAGKKDGKTTCALNLGLSLSERARVLVVDANLFEPDLAKIFCIDETTAASPANAAWLAPYRIAAFSRSLHVAALVVSRGTPAPRFEKQWFEQLVGSLRRVNYDFVLLDAAALSVSPTVSQLVDVADATLLAVRSGTTTARALRRASEQIREGKAIGVALLDAKPLV